MKSISKLLTIFAALAIADADICYTPTPYVFNFSDVTIYIYTQSNPNNADIIPLDGSLDSTNFDSTNHNFVIIHGWTNDALSPVNTILTNALLTNYPLNIFVIDWSRPASNLNYLIAKSAVVPIAQAISTFFGTVMANYNIPAANFKMAGHSLGAHMCGIIGASFDGKVQSIIGMDPAGPCYDEANTDDRLDPTDAVLVQVVHTNAGVFGIDFDCGDSDFYPNGGTNQPGCAILNIYLNTTFFTNLTSTFKSYIFCSHIRSFELVGESILKNSGFTSIQCNNYLNYVSNMCSTNTEAYLGRYDIDNVLGEFYLKTHSASPYSIN